MAKGYILDNKLSVELKIHDCFIMGVSLYNSSQFLEASEWFMETIHLMDKEGDESFMEIFPMTYYVNVLEYLHVSLYYGGK